jgi:hypothetical protein
MSVRPSDGPSAETAARIRAAVAADLHPRPARSSRARVVLAVSAAGIGLALAAVSFGKKLGAPIRQPREMAVALVVFAGAALLSRSLPPFVGGPGSARIRRARGARCRLGSVPTLGRSLGAGMAHRTLRP